MLKKVKDNIQPPNDQQWQKQVQMMNVFDALIYNTDRNRGNILITPDWRLWMIDHTRAFRRNPDAARSRVDHPLRAGHVPEAQGPRRGRQSRGA